MARAQTSLIARRLAWINMSASATALILASLMLVTYDFVSYRGAMIDNRSVQAQIIGSNTVTSLLFDSPSAAKGTLAALHAAPHIEGAALYRPNGQLFAEYRRDETTPAFSLPVVPADVPEWHAFEGLRRMHVVYRVVSEKEVVGIVYIRSDLTQLTDRFRGYAVIVGVVVLISLVAAQLVSRVSRRAISDPIVELASVAKTLARDRDYSVRVRREAAGELEVLISSFNGMLEQIQDRDRSLQESHDLLEQRVAERTEALIASNKELEAFCYSVSHDLRSPLRSIDGFSQALVEDLAGKLDPGSERHLARIRAATQRMGTLIDDLLNLSRIARTELLVGPVDLSAHARAILTELATAQPDRQVEIVIQDGLAGTGDPRLVRQVLENLLGNAWKFTSKRADARVEFGATEEHGQTAYFVRDNGAGFDPAHAERLFGVFQRLHAMNDFPGTGVGLAIVERIVTRHGGRVWATSAVGQGATFYFTLASTPRS